MGDFPECSEFGENPSRVVGIVEQDGYVTLDEGMETNSSYGTSQLSSVTYSFRQALIGELYGKDKEIKFSSVYFTVDGLGDWMGIARNIKSDRSSGESVSVDYKKPPDKKINLGNGFIMTIRHHIQESWSRQIDNNKTTIACDLKLESETELPFKEFRAVIQNLVHFFRFATREEICIKNVSGATQDLVYETEGKKHYPPIDMIL